MIGIVVLSRVKWIEDEVPVDGEDVIFRVNVLKLSADVSDIVVISEPFPII